MNYVIPEQTAKEKYAKATQGDATLQLVIGLVENGCPTTSEIVRHWLSHFGRKRPVCRQLVVCYFVDIRWLFPSLCNQTC